jgi:hypothetical protein
MNSPSVFFLEEVSKAGRREHRLKRFVKMELRSISGHKREEVSKEWRKFHNEEFHNLYLHQILLERC